jgi:hypothetical protein
MGHPPTEVDIAGLAKTGAAVEHAAAGFQAPRDSLAPSGAMPGWASGAALTAAGAAWTEYLGTLTGEVQAFGAGLTSAASDYRLADDDAAGRVRHANGKPVLQ